LLVHSLFTRICGHMRRRLPHAHPHSQTRRLTHNVIAELSISSFTWRRYAIPAEKSSWTLQGSAGFSGVWLSCFRPCHSCSRQAQSMLPLQTYVEDMLSLRLFRSLGDWCDGIIGLGRRGFAGHSGLPPFILARQPQSTLGSAPRRIQTHIQTQFCPTMAYLHTI
jgi:hypothetical protein